MKTPTHAYESTESTEPTLWGRALVGNGLLVAVLPCLAIEDAAIVLPFVCMGCLMMLGGATLLGVLRRDG
jgi:hypothetical protein